MLTPRRTRRITLAMLLVTATLISARPAAAAPPPFWKYLGVVKQIWKESPEARVAAKVLRKTTQKAVSEWRRTGGGTCAWRSVNRSYCRNGFVFATVAIDFSIRGVTVGSVPKGRLLNAACVTDAGSIFGSVRVLWPVPLVPSVLVATYLVEPFIGETFNLPRC